MRRLAVEAAMRMSSPAHSVVRSGPADPEDEPQWLALIVHAAASSGLRQPLTALRAAAILIQPFRFGCFVLWPWSGSLEAKSTWAWTDVEGGDRSPQTMNRTYACGETVSSSRVAVSTRSDSFLKTGGRASRIRRTCDLAPTIPSGPRASCCGSATKQSAPR
jgi:hypothetical protein